MLSGRRNYAYAYIAHCRANSMLAMDSILGAKNGWGTAWNKTYEEAYPLLPPPPPNVANCRPNLTPLNKQIKNKERGQGD